MTDAGTAARSHPDQPVGDSLPEWTPRPTPPATPMAGRLCTLEPLSPTLHADQLFEANLLDRTGASWTYMGYGPFGSHQEYLSWVESAAGASDPQFFAVIDPVNGAVGVTSYLRIAPNIGTIEVGHIHYSPRLQRTAAATEAMYLMMVRAFDELGYRRYEWKCDALNAPSRSAATRLGFTYEGTFRQATMYKGRNRDTAWYSIIDSEWPSIRAAFEAWLAPSNFDESGSQRARLATRG